MLMLSHHDCQYTVLSKLDNPLAICSRAVGHRFGKQLPVALPLVMQHCKSASENDDELRETCLQTLEAFVERSPAEAKGYLDNLTSLALQLLKHDPNYAADMDEDDDDMAEDEEDEDDE